MDPITAANFTAIGLSQIGGSGNSQNQTSITGDPTSNALNANTGFVNGAIGNINNVLSQALGNAINTNTNYTNQAVTQQNTGLNAATTALNNSNTAANSAVTNTLGNSTAQSLALSSPYSTAGLNALDSYEDSLGVARPMMGNAAYQAAQYAAPQLTSQIQPLLSNLGTAAQAAGVSNPYGAQAAAPTLTQANLNQIQQQVTAGMTPQQVQQYIQQHTVTSGPMFNQNGTDRNDYTYNGVGNLPSSVQANGAGIFYDPSARGSATTASQQLVNNPALQQQVQQALIQQQSQQQYTQQQNQNQTQYNTQMSTYNPYATAYQAANTAAQGITPQQLQQLQTAQAAQQGLFGPTQSFNV